MSTVSARYLLEGFWYALERCGQLLHDAIDLYDLGRFGTAAGLAMLAREEMGKAKILLKIANEVDGGRELSPRELADALEDHLVKQRHAQLSVVLSGALGTQLAMLMRKSMDPSDPYSQAAFEELNQLVKQKVRRTPDDRHSVRQRGMYVDPDDTGTVWNRPAHFTKEEALNHITHTMNDYSVLLNNLEHAGQYEKVRALLKDWPDHSELPERRWPSF
jgi:AbiV family abortive infection protein